MKHFTIIHRHTSAHIYLIDAHKAQVYTKIHLNYQIASNICSSDFVILGFPVKPLKIKFGKGQPF